MFGQILTLSSIVLANDCYSCFNTNANDAAKLTALQALELEKYWDPIKETCGDQKNDQKKNLIFKSKEEGIPKTWILHPKHCGSDLVSVPLAQAEEDWVLSQLAYAAEKIEGNMPLQSCIDEKYNSIQSGAIPTSQAKASQFTKISKVESIERPGDYRAPSQANSSETIQSGPIGVFWADKDDELVISWRGTATNDQLMTEIKNIAEQYLKPFGESFVDVQINGNSVGGAFNYFYSNFMDLWNDSKMDDFKSRAKNASKIKVVGHSLGGALATLSAMYLAVEQEIDGDKLQIITFGEPRVSDSTFSVNLNTLVRHQKRFVYSRDLVPHVPPMKDIQGPFNINIRAPQGPQSAFHHSQEVFLVEDFHNKSSPNFSKSNSCGYDDKTNEDGKDCSNSVTDLASLVDIGHFIDTWKNDKQAVYDHTHYWPQYAGICSLNPSTEGPPAASTAAPNTVEPANTTVEPASASEPMETTAAPDTTESTAATDTPESTAPNALFI